MQTSVHFPPDKSFTPFLKPIIMPLPVQMETDLQAAEMLPFWMIGAYYLARLAGVNIVGATVYAIEFVGQFHPNIIEYHQDSPNLKLA